MVSEATVHVRVNGLVGTKCKAVAKVNIVNGDCREMYKCRKICVRIRGKNIPFVYTNKHMCV